MGTNYYARKIPTLERINNIKKAIDSNNVKEIINLIDITYKEPSCISDIKDLLDKEEIPAVVHLGKLSYGWKFLWNPNIYQYNKYKWENIEKDGRVHYHPIPDGYEVLKIYDLTKESIKTFINREDIEIFDEYDEKQNKEEFWERVLNLEGCDGKTYYEKFPDQKKYERHYYTDYMNFLQNLGYKLNSDSDFYSDGLRFATSTDYG